MKTENLQKQTKGTKNRNGIARLLAAAIVSFVSFCVIPRAHALWPNVKPVTGAVPNRVVVSNAVGLASAFTAATNGATIALAPGDYSFTLVTAAAIASAVAPLRISNVTNVTVQGNGARLLAATTNESDFLQITNCDKLVIKDIQFIGNRMAYPALSGRLTAVISPTGTNGPIEIAGCRFINWMRQGIDALILSDLGNRVEYLDVHDCYFENVGSTNTLDGGINDGTCVDCGRNASVRNNVFVNCNRGLELENLGPGNYTDALIISGNRMTNMWAFGVCSFADVVSANYANWTISGNYIDMATNAVPNNQAVAINLRSAKRFSIVDNQIKGGITGIQIECGFDHTQSFIIAKNRLVNIGSALVGAGSGILLGSAGGDPGTYVIRDGSIEGNVLDGCYCRSIAIFARASNIAIRNNHLTSQYAGICEYIRIGLDPTFGQTNIVIEGNTMDETNAVAGTANGIMVLAGGRNVAVRNNLINGPIATTKLDFEADGEIDQPFDLQTTDGSVNVLFSLSKITNAVIWGEMKAAAVSNPALDALSLWRVAGYRNTNSFMSNIVQGVSHTFIWTNATDIAPYVDITNRAAATLDWCVVGKAATTYNWRTRAYAIIKRN